MSWPIQIESENWIIFSLLRRDPLNPNQPVILGKQEETVLPPITGPFASDVTSADIENLEIINARYANQVLNDDDNQDAVELIKKGKLQENVLNGAIVKCTPFRI